jgi:hypothetical protein
LLSQSCFQPQTARNVDAEGCHSLAKEAPSSYPPSVMANQRGACLAFLALAMGRSTGAEDVCEEAVAFFDRESAASAIWIAKCSSYDHGNCASLLAPLTDPTASVGLQEQLYTRFSDATRNLPSLYPPP